MEQLVLAIKGGHVLVEVQGAKGTRCLELTQAIENLLGKISSRNLKEDFYRKVEVKQRISLNHISETGLEK